MARMNVSTKRWIILILICCINLCAGSIYTWSVLSAAAAQELTIITGHLISAANLAIAFGVANSVGPIPMILGGAFNDRYGPRLVIITGGLLIGIGLCFCGWATSVTQIVIGYGLLFGLGLGLAYGAGISTAIKYFPDKRGFAGGLVTAVYGFSSVIVPPIAQVLTQHYGIMNTFVILGTVFALVIMFCGYFCERCPEDFNRLNKHGDEKTCIAVTGLTWRQMLASPIFWPMIALLMCGAVSAMMILSQAASIAQNEIGMNATSAAAAVSTIAFFNMAGRLVAGTLSDKLGRIGVLMFGLIFSALGLIVLMYSGQGDYVFFYCGCILIGISFGTFMSIYPGFTADRFGAKYAGVNYGIMFSGFSVAGLMGPIIMQQMIANGMDFAACCQVGITFCVLGFVFALINKRMIEHKKVQ